MNREIKFDKNNVDHIRCVRDVEMEIRLPYKSNSDDGNEEMRQYVRDVLINKTEQNEDVINTYQHIIGIIESARKIVCGYE